LEGIAEEAEDEFDWANQESLADADRREAMEREEQKEGAADGEVGTRGNPYDKNAPFYNNQPLLVHRILKSKNYEYIFFINEAGDRDIGVFIVLIEALEYKTTVLNKKGK
jgi:hypothetical protein